MTSRRAGIGAVMAIALVISAGLAWAESAVSDVDVALAPPDAAIVAAEPELPPLVVIARIDLSDQRMTITVDERLAYTFKVSTARRGYITPVGEYHALWLSPRHRSRKYDNAPMPWAVFFNGGYAIHGTTEIRALGRPASHGCVRLHPDNAKAFFSLVKIVGMENTLIDVVQ